MPVTGDVMVLILPEDFIKNENEIAKRYYIGKRVLEALERHKMPVIVRRATEEEENDPALS